MDYVRSVASELQDSRLFRGSEPAGVSWYVDQPFDLELFDSVPSPGPYGTFAEAELAARWLWAIVSGGSD